MAKTRAKEKSAKATGKAKAAAAAAAAAAEEGEEKAEHRSSTRERKQVDRYLVSYPTRTPAPKHPTIEEGPGEKLRDIPNVLFKMSKRKTDDNLNVLHTILFGRKSNVKFVKQHILQFSGFVWAGNEVKEKAKVKEKLEKCTKDRLLLFCELFDIPVNKWLTKKEEALEKLLEFLQSPYVNRDVVLEEKEQKGKKRKRTKEDAQAASDEATSDKEETKKQKKRLKTNAKSGRKQYAKANKDDENRGESGDSEKNDHVKNKLPFRKKSSEKMVASGSTKIKQKTSSSSRYSRKSNKSTSRSNLSASASQGVSKAPAKSKKVSNNGPARKKSKSAAREKAAVSVKDSAKAPKKVSKSSKKSASLAVSDSARPSTSKSVKANNKKGHDKPSEGKKAIQKKITKPKPSTKEKGKRKVHAKAIKGPSRKVMLPVVTDILKEVDFEVVTLADILKQLESHFKISLADRKEEVKSIIEEVIKNMSDDEDIEEDEGDAAHDNSDDNHVEEKDDSEKEEVEEEDHEDEEDHEEEKDQEEGSDDGDGNE